MKTISLTQGRVAIKGVYPAKTVYKRTWGAKICANHIVYQLGTFPTELEAARAYNEAAIKLHGEFARLNPVESPADDHHKGGR